MDLQDLRNDLRLGRPLEKIADFLMRDITEVEAKIAELQAEQGLTSALTHANEGTGLDPAGVITLQHTLTRSASTLLAKNEDRASQKMRIAPETLSGFPAPT